MFATVSGECTRNAKSVVLARRSDAIGRTWSGDEGIIMSNNDHHEKRVNKERIDTQLACDLEGEVMGNVLVAGNEC